MANGQRPLICVGEDANTGEPLLLPIEAFIEGLFLYGPPGSGKTIQLAMLARQLALAGNANLSQGGPGASILLMDLKGDDFLYYHILREIADVLGIPFRVVTNETDHLATFPFNPLDSQMMPKLDAYARAEFVCGATGLLAGREYGKGWFSSATAELIFYAFKKYPRLRSFRECYKLLTEVLNAPKKIYQHEIHPEFVKSGLHALAVMGRLARLDALNATSRGDHAKLITDHNVDLADLFIRPQIVLFHLNTTKGLYTGPEIALMAAFSLIFGASSVTGERIQTFLLLDEASKAAHENVRHILEQCRSMQISTCLATQSLSALANKGVDLRDAVLTDERIRWWLGIPHPDEQRWFSTTAGERRVILEGLSERRNWDGFDVTNSYSETVMPLYPINAVKTITNRPDVDAVRTDTCPAGS